MAANKLATMLNRNSPRFIAVLVYAVLEWVLLLLLLLNSFLTYLITKFANYFGLKPPCPLCSSRVEHTLEQKYSYTDRVCENHAKEIWKVRYCHNHKRLAESHKMCRNCFASRPNGSRNKSDKDKEETVICSCCNESCTTILCSGILFLEASSMDYAQKGDSIVEAVHHDNNEGTTKSDSASIHSKNGYEMETTFSFKDTTAAEDCINEKEKLVQQSSDATTIECCFQDDQSLEITPLPSESGMVCDLARRLMPTELVDLPTTPDEGRLRNRLKDREQDTHYHHQQGGSDTKSKIRCEDQLTGEEALVMVKKSAKDTIDEQLKRLVMARGFADDSSSLQVDNTKRALVGKPCDDAVIAPSSPNVLVDAKENDAQASEEESNMAVIPINLLNKEVSYHAAEQSKAQEKTRATESAQQVMNLFCSYSEPNVTTAMDGEEPGPTIEQLKEALEAESRALSALYAELEEERSASAIAANQTMAMITRLQEEKAAMQMEALQYQRIMEEQAEYDQEALLLLNELMNEKQELEKDLEIYRMKVLDYEEKEKMRVMSRTTNGSISRNSSASRSQSWDSDALSIDLNCNEKNGYSSCFYCPEESSNNNYSDDAATLSLEEMALDCIKQISILDESLSGFQEERLSIPDHLKALEDRLIVLSEKKDYSQDAQLLETAPQYTKAIKAFKSPEENHISDGVAHNAEKITLASMAKRLLPLLDAADSATKEDLTNEKQAESEPIAMHSSLSSSELHDNRIANEEEVDHVYKRLQALEADREFLNNCMSSKNKGDKGMDLQEILEHHQDLRAVELCKGNMNGPVDEAEAKLM